MGKYGIPVIPRSVDSNVRTGMDAVRNFILDFLKGRVEQAVPQGKITRVRVKIPDGDDINDTTNDPKVKFSNGEIIGFCPRPTLDSGVKYILFEAETGTVTVKLFSAQSTGAGYVDVFIANTDTLNVVDMEL